MFTVIYLKGDEVKKKSNLLEQDAQKLAASTEPGSYPIIYDMIKFKRMVKELNNGLVLRR